LLKAVGLMLEGTNQSISLAQCIPQLAASCNHICLRPTTPVWFC